LADRLQQAAVPLRTFGARHWAQFPWIIRALSRQMKADRPRLLQSFLFHANVLGALAARRAGVPHVLTGIRVAERRHGWHLRLARWTDRWVERHVCVSRAVRDFSATSGGLPENKLVVIPNGVDLSRFDRPGTSPVDDLGVPRDRRFITCIGRLDPQKGLDWLLELVPPVLADCPRHDVLIVGEGPQRAALLRQAASRGVGPRVHFAGFRADVPRILAASDVLALPSRWEGMPNVLLEAMAAGKPVVATDVEGVTEALGPAAAQQVVRRDHAEAFAAKLRAILQNPALAAELGRANRRQAESLSVEKMVAAYERLFLDCLAIGP
jgi:glycosyltransferase involved in cell wall biosynthesis